MQVKLNTIEIKVQFTILLENFEQDFRLLMNDCSNLFRTKESLARNYSVNNWSKIFEKEPLIKIILRSILRWTKFPDNISKLFLNKKKTQRMFSTHATTFISGGRQIWMDLNRGHTKSLIKPPKNWRSIDVNVASSDNMSSWKTMLIFGIAWHF